MKKWMLYLALCMLSLTAWATHQRAGEITYEHLSGLTYRFTIITYTYTPSAADRPQIEVFWGDGNSSVVDRYQKINMDNDISRNIYITEHTYPSTGTYHVTFEDPNRNNGIVNIPNSVSIPFFLETILVINPFLGANSSPQLLNPPIDNGCTNTPYYHNPGAYDPDGDSLSYSLIACRGYEGEDIPGYALPAASNYISINPQTGDLTWDSPLAVGEYNIAILISEWRHGVLIGSVVRDMQITILACNNQPPEILTCMDTCITAGQTLQLTVTATDANSTIVRLTASGGVFGLSDHHATFPTAEGTPPVSSQFIWNTTCSHIRLAPYNVLFKAVDNGPQVNLTSYKTLNIHVVAPKPENLLAEPVGNTIEVSWSLHACTQTAGYRIYRRNGSYDFEPDNCETGLPGYTGYQLVGETHDWSDCLFIDDGSSLPLYHGNEYCYRVVAYYADGSESYVSDEACTVLHNDVPRLTHADIEVTDSENGVINVEWIRPTELDTLQYPGPQYQYRLYRANSLQPNDFQLIYTGMSLQDTQFTDMGLNTFELTYIYKVEVWAEVHDSLVLAGTSDAATSIRLAITPQDCALLLEWGEAVPWTNTEYTVFKWNEESQQFDSIATTIDHAYTDRGLLNGTSYCYIVRSTGGYYAPDTIAPFLNRSQKDCAVPADLTPPEVPQLTVTTDCETVELSWTFSNDSAYLDVYQYYIYYKSTIDEDFTILDSFYIPNDCYHTHCTYSLADLPYVIGCFAMAAIDTVGNLSQRSDSVCFDIDDCFTYELPNIITPNGDGYNDILIPFPYKNVQGVDFYLYNRWGRLVYKTSDIDIQWDGTDMSSHQTSSDGTYYYVCQVHLHSLHGPMTKELHGTLTVIR